MDWKNHIEVDPNVLVGKPVIKGARISVELLLDRSKMACFEESNQ